MFFDSKSTSDAQAMRLLAQIDLQLDRWAKKYRFGDQHEASKAPSTAMQTGIFREADVQATKDSDGISRETAPASGCRSCNSLSDGGELAFSELLARVALLEKQLRDADRDRDDLRGQLKAMERQLSGLHMSFNALQNEWVVFRDEAFMQSQSNTGHCRETEVVSTSGWGVSGGGSSDSISRLPKVNSTDPMAPDVTAADFNPYVSVDTLYAVQSARTTDAKGTI